MKVGLHQGSALSPYLFDLVVDVTTKDVKEAHPAAWYLWMTSHCAETREKKLNGSWKPGEDCWKKEVKGEQEKD